MTTMNNQRFARQELVFGKEGQAKIEAERIGVVGAGGLGSHVIQGLTYMGAIRVTTIDDDLVEDTNLNRLAGAGPADVGRPKVHVAGDMMRQINPISEPILIFNNLRSHQAIEALKKCTTIFGCVDHDGPRLILTELTSAYLIPYIDVATEIFPPKNGQELHFGGRVIVSQPGDYCLYCANQIDREIAKQDLESKEVQAERKKHGYGLGDSGQSPSVFGLNGVLANLALMEFLKLVTGIAQPARRLTYKGERGIVTSSTDSRSLDCLICATTGQKELANIDRFALE